MKRFLKLVLWIFYIFFTGFILVYTVILSLFNKQTIHDIHEAIPPLATIGSFLGVWHRENIDDETYKEKERTKKKLQNFLDWKQVHDSKSASGHHLIFDDERTTISLYSPIWTFQGRVSDDVTSLHMYYIHPGRNEEKEYEITLGHSVGDDFHWSKEVDLGKESLFNGKNIYIIEAVFADGTKIRKQVVLYVDYERLEIGDKILYIDPSYVPEGTTESLLRKAEDLDGEEVHFVSYGCDPAKNVPDLLLRQNHQYTSIPACISFSYSQKYLLQFLFTSKNKGNYYFDIVSSDKKILYYSFPLLEKGLNTVYYNFVYWDKEDGLLKFLKAKGDALQYAIEISYYDIVRKQNILSIVHTNGSQLLVENAKEKMFIYLYKERSNYHSLIYPGLRYIFHYNGEKINQGPLYTLPFRLIGPAKEYLPTFSFKIQLDGFILYIDDGIKTISFDTRLIGRTIEVTDSKSVSSNTCDQAYVDIYKNRAGRSIKNTPLHTRDTLWLVGEGLYTDKIKIFHNGVMLHDLGQYYRGWFHLVLNVEKGNLQKGNNIYTIVAYDKQGKELCSFEKNIVIE